jgi:hypothetical protein
MRLVFLFAGFSLNFLFCTYQLIAQNKESGYDSVFGFDPVLYNGRYYTFQAPKNSKGNPFIYSPEFVAGKILINNNSYNAGALNYDIYNQQLLWQRDL